MEFPTDRLIAAKRILVLGSSGSGKTTLTRQLSKILDIEPIHLDACFWQPGWISTPQPLWRQRVEQLVERDAWIMDGTYESTLDIRLPAAEALVILVESRWRCLWRIIQRRWTVDDRVRTDAPPGQKVDRAFLRYVWQYPTITEPMVWDLIRKYAPDTAVKVVHGNRAKSRFLQALRQERQDSAAAS